MVPPKDGWQRQVAALQPATDFPIVRSSVEANIDEKKTAYFVVFSYGTIRDGITSVHYDIANHGTESASILINIPVEGSGSMDKDLPFVYGAFFQPDSSKRYSSKMTNPVMLQPATVAIMDGQTKEIVAVDVVGVYAPMDGKRLRSDADLISSFRQ